VTTPAVNPVNQTNYTIASVNGTLTVGYVQNDCFAWPLPATPPARVYGVVPGLPVPAVCRLENGRGVLITTARGDIEVFDVGPNATSEPVRVATVPNAFAVAYGAYWAWVSTDGFARGRYYRVVATWDDGSTSTGYLYVRE
jgi:hypothetical protein